MQKINWENGTVTKDAYVTIDGTEYTVTPEEYEGNTPLSAENLNLMQNNIETAINDLTNQKILWTGGYLMTADHIVNLSENISNQKSGIILVFSAYRNEVQNWGWNFQFIPKQFVEIQPGAGCVVTLNSGSFASNGTKYLYVSNDRIVGHSDNSKSGTNNGVTYKNSDFVLRYVIGV